MHINVKYQKNKCRICGMLEMVISYTSLLYLVYCNETRFNHDNDKNDFVFVRNKVT